MEKPKSYDDIEAQYIGLMKISKYILDRILNIEIEKEMYITDFIQKVIDEKIVDATPVLINGGWLVIDNIFDLKVEIEKL